MLFMGIDQSFTKTGIVIIDQDKNVVDAKVIHSNPSDDIFFRAWQISEEVTDVISKYKPDLIGIEGLAFGMRGNATRDLAGLQFTIVNRIRFIYKRSIVIISPLTIKKLATGKGHAKKDEVIHALPEPVLEYFIEQGAKKSKGLPDLADAYWLARALGDEKLELVKKV